MKVMADSLIVNSELECHLANDKVAMLEAEVERLKCMLRLAHEDIRMDCTWVEFDDWLADLRRKATK